MMVIQNCYPVAAFVSFLFLAGCLLHSLLHLATSSNHQIFHIRWRHQPEAIPTSMVILKMRISEFALLALTSLVTAASIDRERVIGQFNPVRHASSNSTPMQVGNGNFAFGTDITGLQTFQPFAIMSSWGWHNFSLPTAPGQSKISDFTGLDWYL